MAKRYTRKADAPRCLARTSSGKRCTNPATENGACGISAHQEQVAAGDHKTAAIAHTRATPQRARKATRPKVPAKVQAQQRKFLAAYRQIGIITLAAEEAGIDRRRHYEWIEDVDRFPDYAADYADAHEEAVDRIEAELHRRAVRGIDEPVYGRKPGSKPGVEVVGHIRRYSDSLLGLLIKAKRRSFRDSAKVKVGVAAAASVNVYIPDNGRSRDSQIQLAD